METWRYGDMEMETRKHVEMETWRQGDTWRHGHGDIKRKTDAQAIFLIVQSEFVVCPFVDEETN